MTEFIEMSDELASLLVAAESRISDAADQLRTAEHARQRLLDDAVSGIAEFKVGQMVLSHGKRYRITRVSGEEFGISGHRSKVWLRYSGEKLKINGEPMGRARRLYDITAVSETDAEGSER